MPLWHFFCGLRPRGATTTGPDATPPPPSYLSKLGGGGGQLGRGGRREGGGGGLAARRGAARNYYHMHTSRVCVCLGAWGYRGMYAIIAISCLCCLCCLCCLWKKVLRVLRTKGIVTLSTKHGTNNLAPLAPWPPHRYLSKLGAGAGGLGGVAYKDWARPPPPAFWQITLQCTSVPLPISSTAIHILRCLFPGPARKDVVALMWLSSIISGHAVVPEPIKQRLILDEHVHTCQMIVGQPCTLVCLILGNLETWSQSYKLMGGVSG